MFGFKKLISIIRKPTKENETNDDKINEIIPDPIDIQSSQPSVNGEIKIQNQVKEKAPAPIQASQPSEMHGEILKVQNQVEEITLSPIDIQALHPHSDPVQNKDIQNQSDEGQQKLNDLVRIVKSDDIEHKINKKDAEIERLPQNNSKLTPFERDLAELNALLNIELIQQFLEQGQDAVRNVRGKDICVFLGSTAAGKTTTLLYLMGEEMHIVEIRIDYIDQDGNKQYHTKKIISSVEKIEDAKIGNGTVSQTQFLKVFPIKESAYRNKLLSDSAGIRDNRTIEIDLTNNLNIMSVLKACNSVRFFFLVNYHELKAQTGEPFRETALIVAKMLNGKDFENNLKSMSVFYSQAQDVTMKSIYADIQEQKKGLNQMGMISPADKELLSTFFDYLLKLIYTEDSAIINPLDSQSRGGILQSIFEKPGLIRPLEKLSSQSFSQVGESKIKFYCNSAKEMIEDYANQFKFHEVSELLNLLYELFTLIKHDTIDALYQKQRIKIEKDFKFKIDQFIYQVIENLKNGNRFLQHQLDKLAVFYQSLQEWDKKKQSHFQDSEIDSMYLSQKISDQFNKIMQATTEIDESFECLIKMTQGVEQLKDILFEESSNMKQQICSKIKDLMESQTKKAFKEIEETIKKNCFENKNEELKFIQNILETLTKISKKEEQLLKYNMTEGIGYKEKLTEKIQSSLYEKASTLNTYFEEALQSLDQQSTKQHGREETCVEATSKKMSQFIPQYQLLMAFATNPNFYEYCPKIQQVKESIEAQVKQVLKAYLCAYSAQLKEKKLKSKYMKESFMIFLQSFIQSFYINDSEIQETYRNYYGQFELTVKQEEEKIKVIVKELTHFKEKSDSEHKDDTNNATTTFNGKDPFEKVMKKLQIFQSVRWMDSYLGSQIISSRLEYCIKKLQAFSINLVNSVDKIAEQIYEEEYLDKKRILFQQLQKQYCSLKGIKRHFGEMLPKANDRFTEIQESLQNQYKYLSQKINGIVQSLETTDSSSRHLLFDIETTLMCLKYVPKEVLSNQQLSEGELIEKFDQQFKKQLNMIPNSQQSEILLSEKDDERFKSWNNLLEQMELVRQDKQNLLILLEKSSQSLQILDEKTISNKIRSLYNRLKNKMNEDIEMKEFQRANLISLKLNSMSGILSQYFEFEYIYNIGSIIRQEAKDVLNDIENQNNLKSVKERLTHLKGISSNQKDCELIQNSLQEQYDRQLKLLINHIKILNLKDSELQQKIENLFEMKYVLDEILEADKLLDKFNTVLKIPFQNWAKDVLTSEFLLIKRNGNEKQLVDIFNWYKKILDCFTQYGVDTSDFIKLENILMQNINDQIKRTTSKSISIWTKEVFLIFTTSIDEINSYKSLFLSNMVLQDKLQSSLDTLKDFLDKESQYCKDKFKEYSQSSPVNINEVKKVLIVVKKLEQIYQDCFQDCQISELIQELELDLEQKEYASILPIHTYLKSEHSTDVETNDIISNLNELSKKDKSGFTKAKELLTKMNEECNSHLEKILRPDQKIFSSLLPILQQLLKLMKLKQFVSTQNVATTLKSENLMKQLQQEFYQFQLKLQDISSNSSKLIQQSDIINYFDMQQCMALMKQNPNISNLDLENMKKINDRINNSICDRVRESTTNFKLCKQNSNYKGLYQSLSSLKNVDGIISYIKQLQLSESKAPKYCDQKLWEIVENSKINNHEAAQEEVQQVMQQVGKNLKQSWEKNNFKTFAQYFKNLKELQDDNPHNQLMQNEYTSLKQKYEQQIDCQLKLITNFIEQEDWGDQLSCKVDLLQEQVLDLTSTDLYYKVTQSNDQTNKKLKDKLTEKFNQFKSATSIQNKCSLLVDLRKICDQVPNFEVPIKKKISECIDTLVASSNDGQKQIFTLLNCLNNCNESVAELILKETQHFSSINTKNFKEKISRQHNPDYINKNLKKLNLLTKKTSPLLQVEQNGLRSKYIVFQEKFTKIVDQNLKRISEIYNLAQDIINFSEQKKYLNLDSWDAKSQDDCNDLLAQVCAFWTLSSLQEDSIQSEKEMVYKELHASQIFSIMVLLGFEGQQKSQKLESHFIQVLTGEGKSLVLGILSTILALLRYKVDVVCYSKHLSERDFSDFEKFFDSLKIKDKIKYGTFTDLCNDKLNEIGDIRKMSVNILDGIIQNKEAPTQQKSIQLIDEVDEFFSVSFFGQTYNPCCLFKSKEILNIMNKIWKNRTLNNQTLTNSIFKDNDFLEIVKKYPQMERLFKAHIKSMVGAAVTIEDHKYIFQDGKIGYQQHDSISFTTVYGYSTNFAYFQEMDKGKLTEDQVKQICGINLKCGHFSYCLLPFLYSKILGVTGTLETLNQEYLNIVKDYTQKATLIPSMFGASKLDEDHSNFCITFDQDNFFLAIINKANKHLEQGQPVLIFFKDNSILDEFQQSTHAAQFKDKLQVLNQNTKHIKTTIDKACRFGQLTLGERAFGRGTDFYCSNKEINKLGGAVVIQTFFSEDISEEYQIKGRTARQSNEGQFFQIVQAKDIEEVLHIKVDELKEKAQAKSQLYVELDKKRRQLYAEKVKLLTESAAQAALVHDQTKKYSQFLMKNQRDEALNMLIQFNSGNSKESNSELIHFILLLDDSGSMDNNDGTDKSRWQRLIEAIHTFIQERTTNSVTDGDISSIVYHSSSSVVITKYQSLNNLSSILSKSPPRYEGNQFYLAIDETIKILDQEQTQHKPMKKVILFLSDGGDGASRAKLHASLDNLKSKYKDQILGFWNIGFGPGAEAGALKDMTDRMKECGGEYKTAMNLVELQKNFQDLATIDSQPMNIQ